MCTCLCLLEPQFYKFPYITLITCKGMSTFDQTVVVKDNILFTVLRFIDKSQIVGFCILQC